MGINSGLYSLEKNSKLQRKTQEILWLFFKIAICRTQQLDCILRTNLQQPFSNKGVGQKYCLRITILWEKMGKCPFQKKKNPAFCPLFPK